MHACVQVVGLVDSGVDLDSCFLWDPNFLDYQTGSSTQTQAGLMFTPGNVIPAIYQDQTPVGPVSKLPGVKIFQNSNHRKVGTYRPTHDPFHST